MCGHLGIAYVDPRQVVDSELLKTCADTIVHRGPDSFGSWTRGPIGAAFRRLSIIDLEGGHQPLVDEREEVALLANGEIYNFKELRLELEARGCRFRTDSDCEVLLHGYREHGVAFVERLVGMFAFAILDLRQPQRPRIVLGRDRLGIKPLYFAETSAGLYWASEPKAILATESFSRRMRAPALLDYLVQGYSSGPQSAWEGIQRLLPGSLLVWTPTDGVKLQSYWDLPLDGPREAGSEEQLSGEILELLDRCVADRLVADVPLGAFLSGGIDSTAVVTSMARQVEDPVVACSVGFREKSHNELDIARHSARRLGCVHHEQILEPDPRLALDVLPWLFDEPNADPSTVPTYLVSKMAREHVTVALSGDGGDETFAGYRRYVHDVAENRIRKALPGGQRALALFGRIYPKMDWAPRVLRAKTFLSNLGSDPARAYWNSVSILTRDQAVRLLAPELRDALREHDPFEAFRAHYDKPNYDDPLYRAQYADFHTYLTDQILAKVDRASMGVSLEVRVPLLDHRFVEGFANLPTSAKVRGSRGKHALREALRSRLPSEVLDGQKRGFDTPLKGWIQGPLKESVREAVETLPDTWFDRKVLKSLLAEHSSGARDHGRILWSLLVLEHWRRRHAVRDVSV